MCKHMICLTTLILIWAVLVPVAPVNAAVWTGAAGDGDWRNPGNWSGAVPDDGERADIDNASDMIWPALAEGTGNCSQARIGHEATMIGELTVTGGATLNVAGELRLGRKSSNPLPTGTLYISGGDTQALVGERIECGRYGNGIIDMSGGLLRTEAELRLGFRDSGFGTVYLRGGTLEANANPGITVSGGGDTGQGLVYIDDIMLTPFERETITPTEPSPANLIAHYAFEGNVRSSAGSLHGRRCPELCGRQTGPGPQPEYRGHHR